MEHLSKQQIVLLTLLVSFVTSIATGITTVSLMDQSPASVTQTINRVVEKTIEKVVPVPSPASPSKEVTVVVKEEDLVIKSVESVKNSIVRLTNRRDPNLFGIGIIINNNGLFVSDIETADEPKGFSASYKGVNYEVALIQKDEISGLAFYRLPPEAKGVGIGFGNMAQIKSGQSIVALSGKERDIVSIGVLSSVIENDIKTESGIVKKISSIETTLDESSLSSGTPLSNLEGKLIAIKTNANRDGIAVLQTSNIIIEAKNRLSLE